jgi:hypothetical protein
MTRVQPSSTLSVFEPKRTYVNDAAYGDLAALGNMRDVRVLRREAFTTDSLGFRNAVPEGSRPVAVTIGTSFIAGSGLSDDETLARRLSALLGDHVYNAGGVRTLTEQTVDTLCESIDLKNGGTAVIEYFERAEPPALGKPPAGDTLGRAVFDRILGPLRSAELGGWLRSSPLRIFLATQRKAIENGILLPNSYGRNVIRKDLVNGDPMLFFPEDYARPGWPADAPRRAAEYFQSLRSRLAKRHARLFVVIIPTKYTVYGSLLRETADTAPNVEFLEQMQAALVDAGVPVANLTRTMQQAAREGLARRDYVYWRDDTHWNPTGVSLAAAQIALQWRGLGLLGNSPGGAP